MTALSSLTTLGLGGPVRHLRPVSSAADAVDAITFAREHALPFTILAGGSNVIADDAGYAGVLLHVQSRGVTHSEYGGRVYVTAAAGEAWDSLVSLACDEGWSGIECLSGIPGSVGATPIQNVGAYGQEVRSTIASVEVLDLATLRTRTLSPTECGFGYRTSRFKRDGGFLVLSVTFCLVQSDYSAPIKYAELAKQFQGASAPLSQVRNKVISLRRSKGMVVDPSDPDSKSVGSFFMNPIMSQAPAGAPTFPADNGVKVPAAWLVEHSGFHKGYTEHGVGISSKHALALVNRGGTSKALLALAARIEEQVHQRFGVRLEREPVLLK